MHTTLHKVSDLTVEQNAARKTLSETCYPPGIPWHGESIEWSRVDWSSICWENNVAHAHAGGIIRQGTLNSKPVKIGGVGGVMTLPESRGQGLASDSIRLLLELFERENVDFVLLVCEKHLIPMYEKLGFRIHDGEMMVTQRGKEERFDFNHVMTRSVRATETGSLNLMGPPW